MLLAADNVVLRAGEISLERNREGRLVTRGRDLNGQFNLALLANIEPIELAELLEHGI